jgi:two-component system phosphate regulon sensor histidine kinase PhoR
MDNSIYIYIGIGSIAIILIGYLVYVFVTGIRAKTQLKAQKKIGQEEQEEIEWLSVSTKQFKRLFDEAPVPYFILSITGEIKDLNKAGLRFFGVMPEDIVGKNFFSFTAEEDSDYAGYLLTCCKLSAPVDNKEIRMVSKNSEIRWVQLSILGITEPGSKDPSSLATIFDVTERKDLDQAKTEFVSLASHQMRAPLATVKWYTEMLMHPQIGELNAKQAGYVRIVNEVNADMIELVDTLLNVSRSEIGKLVVDMGPTNVQEVTDSILLELSSQIDKKKMSIVKQYDGLFTNVTSDPKLLRIVIHNLVTNAIKYTPDEGTITISFKQTDGKNQVVVSDTGYGIPQAQQGKIFTKLFRADNVKEISSSQSTGLGLYLVKSLIEAMGGDISFQSEENKGTAFTVSF